MDSDLLRWVKAQADDPNANPRFRELLAALEAAREDANLVYRMIPTLPVTPETCEQATDALTQFCLSFHAAIDQARGKAGGEVEGG